MTVVDEHGNLTQPLFHGTSDIIAAQILETGLGRKNLLIDLQAFTLFEELMVAAEEFSETFFVPSANWDFLQKMRLQDTSGTLVSIHGPVFVSASFYSAARYARNPVGSEFLSTAMEVHLALTERRPELVGKWDEHPAVVFARLPHRPVVIEILPGVLSESLLTEGGSSAIQVKLELWEKAVTEGMHPLLQGITFRLTKEVESAQLRVHGDL